MSSHLLSLVRGRRTLLVLGLFILVWVLFLDSHSVFNRVRWHYQAEQLREENERIEQVIQRAEDELSKRDDKSEVERIARESYRMRRDGETVYRVEGTSD